MQNFIGYMFFSFIEGFAVFALMFYLFRINMMKYIKPIILVNIFINFVSFLIRKEPLLADMSPIMNLAICVLLMAQIVRIPFIWSMLTVLTGYMAFGVIQASIVFFSFMSIEEWAEVVWKGYVFQLLSGIIGTAIGFMIYRLGYGFTFEFDKLRFKWERIFIIGLSFIFLISVIITLASKKLFVILLVFTIAFVFFLLYSYWKDADE